MNYKYRTEERERRVSLDGSKTNNSVVEKEDKRLDIMSIKLEVDGAEI